MGMQFAVGFVYEVVHVEKGVYVKSKFVARSRERLEKQLKHFTIKSIRAITHVNLTPDISPLEADI